MPLLFTCDQLRPGMQLAAAFMLRGRVMLPGGKVLTEADVEVLQRKFPSITLRIGDPVLDNLVEFEDDSRERQVAEEATSHISHCMHKVHERFGSRTTVATVNFNSLKSAACDVMDYLKDHPVSAALLDQSLNRDSYLVSHTGNVFYLCMVLGAAVRDYVVRERTRQTSAATLTGSVSMDLTPLGLGAMFLDLGMYPLEHLINQEGPLSEADRALVAEHPIAGAEMLPESMPPATRMIVRTHHENFSGCGYPARMPGANQHVFTRIARICDAYNAATATHVYKKAKSPARALWEITCGPYRQLYDPVLARVFMGLIQPFPIGAKMHMSDGQIAVVVRYNRQHPFKPQVIVAFDRNGERLPATQVPKAVTPGDGNALRIASFEGEDLSYLQDAVDKEALPVERTNFFAMAYP